MNDRPMVGLTNTRNQRRKRRRENETTVKQRGKEEKTEDMQVTRNRRMRED
jgi:hypothetical protein